MLMMMTCPFCFLSLSPFLDHWRVKISYDFLAPADSFVDCRFPSAKIFGKEKGRQSAAFPLPFSWVILFYRQRRSDFKSSLGVWPRVIRATDTLAPAWRSQALHAADRRCIGQTSFPRPGTVPTHVRSRAGKCPHI